MMPRGARLPGRAASSRLGCGLAVALLLGAASCGKALAADTTQSTPPSVAVSSQSDGRIAALLDRAERQVEMRQLASATDKLVDALGLMPSASPAGQEAVSSFPTRLRLRAQTAAASGNVDLATNLRAFADVVAEATANAEVTANNVAAPSREQAATSPEGGAGSRAQPPDSIRPAPNVQPPTPAVEPPQALALAPPPSASVTEPATGAAFRMPPVANTTKPPPELALPAAARQPIPALPRPPAGPLPPSSDKASTLVLQTLSAIRGFIPRAQQCGSPLSSGEGLKTDAAEIPAASPDFFIVRGDQMLGIKQVAEARRFFECAAADGSARAATGVGKTYDPAFLAAIGVTDVSADPVVAETWYRKGMALGDREAEARLQELEFWGRKPGEERMR
jgi:hypothetical protein